MIFNVGDRVRVTTRRFDNDSWTQYGLTGVVLRIGGYDASLPIQIKYDDRQTPWSDTNSYAETDLEPFIKMMQYDPAQQGDTDEDI